VEENWFLEKKWQMTLSLNVQSNGSAIDLLVSRDQRTFGSAVRNEFVTVLGPDAIAYSTVTKHLRQRQFPSLPCDPSGKPPKTVIDNSMLDALEKQRFSSIRELANLTCISTAIIHRH
jgi:hypothetical protein